MTIQQNHSLKEHNTFKVEAKAKYFAEINHKDELIDLLQNEKFKNEKLYLLGGGSNVLILNDLEGLVIKIKSTGIEKISEDSENIKLKIQAGQNWHELVKYTVDNEFFGIENLALIPGTVGGAAAQNIAAYGQNLEDTLDSLTAINRTTFEVKTFTKLECEFAYRTSRFKNKTEWIILEVVLNLKTHGNIEQDYHDRYLSLEGELKLFAKEPYTIKDIFTAVVNIRNKKLPKVEEWGTCGSFFTNPYITVKKFKELSKVLNELQRYPVEGLKYNVKDWDKVDSLDEDMMVKIPAGRLLEELGWKGKWIGNVGTFDKHALCVVTNWKASGQEIFEFVNLMKKSVKDAYGIDLISEIIIMQ